MGGRGRCAVVAHLPYLEFLQLLLEVADIPPAIPDVAVDSSLDRRVVRGLSHVACSVDEGLFSLYLLVDVRHRGVGVGHLEVNYRRLVVTIREPREAHRREWSVTGRQRRKKGFQRSVH